MAHPTGKIPVQGMAVNVLNMSLIRHHTYITHLSHSFHSTASANCNIFLWIPATYSPPGLPPKAKLCAWSSNLYYKQVKYYTGTFLWSFPGDKAIQTYTGKCLKRINSKLYNKCILSLCPMSNNIIMKRTEMKPMYCWVLLYFNF
jgi:hypothetical protein